MEKRFTVEIDVFGFVVEVYVGHDYVKLMDHFKEIGLNIGCDEAVYDGCKGVFMALDHKNGDDEVKFLWLKKFDGSIDDLGVVSHESVHAAQFVLDECQIDCDWQGTEQVAYVQEYIFKSILKGLNYEIPRRKQDRKKTDTNVGRVKRKIAGGKAERN